MSTPNLTGDQFRDVVEAIGDGYNFPRATNDPVVNWAVDCLTQGEMIDYDEALYESELDVFEQAKESA